MNPYKIHVVLVRTIYESNIGATARSMSNMGAEDLILIDPKTEIGLKGHQSAANGQRPLENRKVYPSWEEFFKKNSNGIRISLTAKDGKNRMVEDLAETLKRLKKSHLELDPSATEKIEPLSIYLIFGPEDWGLSGADIENTHFSCSLPIFGDNTSFNLAQAVLLTLFILRSEWGGPRTEMEGKPSSKYVRKDQNAFPDEALKGFLEAMGLSTKNRKVNAYTVLKRMILHSVPSEKEIRILEIVLQQGIRKLNEYNELRKSSIGRQSH
jgi:tRNA/rRNA methyltransferase